MSWNWSKTVIIKIDGSRAFKLGIICINLYINKYMNLNNKKLPKLIPSSDFSYARSKHFWHFVLLVLASSRNIWLYGISESDNAELPFPEMWVHGFETLWIWALSLILIRYDNYYAIMIPVHKVVILLLSTHINGSSKCSTATEMQSYIEIFVFQIAESLEFSVSMPQQ